jgi:hypothetical protein
MVSYTEILISRYLTDNRCTQRLLSGDGITAQDFTIRSISGIVDGISIESKTAKQIIPELGRAMSLAKNLDEYENKMCKLVGSLPDSQYKLQLQKFRIGTVASFSKLANLIRANDKSAITQWSKSAENLLEAASNSVSVGAAASSDEASKRRVSEALAFFGTPEETVDKLLKSYYGLV